MMKMHRNPIRKIWSEGRGVINGWLSIPSPFCAEIMASCGYDSVTIDTQHGAIGYDAMVGMLQALRASGVAPMVRAPWLEPGAIMKTLDAGAWGVICPMVNSRSDAERLSPMFAIRLTVAEASARPGQILHSAGIMRL